MKTQELDYDELARLSEKTGKNFATLCDRAEKGLPLPKAPDEQWVTTETAAKILCTCYTMAVKHLRDSEVRQQSRSMTNPSARRGCGVLYNKADLLSIMYIRKKTEISLSAAVKVFNAISRGDL